MRWSRGFSFGLWNFQSGLGRWRRRREQDRGERTASSSRLLHSRWWSRVRKPSLHDHEPGDWRRRAEYVRGLPDACEYDLKLVSGDGVRGSWSLGSLRGELADKNRTRRLRAPRAPLEQRTRAAHARQIHLRLGDALGAFESGRVSTPIPAIVCARFSVSSAKSQAIRLDNGRSFLGGLEPPRALGLSFAVLGREFEIPSFMMGDQIGRKAEAASTSSGR